jgi:Fe-S cluster biogenesis protein NfuA
MAGQALNLASLLGRLYTKKTKILEVSMRKQVEEVLNMIRPALQADGGDVELVDVTDEGVVSVKLKGACGSCPMSTMTLKMGIEKNLKEKVPGVTSVIQV